MLQVHDKPKVIKTVMTGSSAATPLERFRPRNKPPSRVHSRLFDGSSVVDQLMKSSYGCFQEYLLQSGLQAQLQQNLRLPQVIVVGGRSAGKSSLLESITKCPIFPRHQDFCTKMPIILKMKNVPTAVHRQVTINYFGRPTKRLEAANDILTEVNAIMQGVAGIDSKPITIEICQADVPTFQVVDLPGIQTYPKEQEKATTELVSSYLKRPDTLALCVLDATTTAFDSSVALKLVRDSGKLGNTIIALTKSDLLKGQEYQYVPKIFDRILGQSSDNQHLQGLAGCVAVANCQEFSDVSLAEADAAERDIFNSMMDDPAPAFKDEQMQLRLRANTTVKRLIVQLDSMFHRYIVQHWKPAALERIADMLDAAHSNLDLLGRPVEDLSPAGIMQCIMAEIDYNELCEAVLSQSQAKLQVLQHTWDWDVAQVLCCAHAWGSLEWANALAKLCTKADLLVTKISQTDLLTTHMLQASVMLNPLCQQLGRVFNSDHPLNLNRFSSLSRHITLDLMPDLVRIITADVKPKLERLVEFTFAELYRREPISLSTENALSNLDDALAGCVLSHFMQAIQAEARHPKILVLPDTFQLQENQEVHQQRSAFHIEIAKLLKAHEQISCIEDAFSAPESPTAAHAAAVNDTFRPEASANQDGTSDHSDSLHQTLPVSTELPVPGTASALAAADTATAARAPVARVTGNAAGADLAAAKSSVVTSPAMMDVEVPGSPVASEADSLFD